jgi:hypothetical protein
MEPDADIFPYVDLFLGLHLVRLILHFPKEPIPGALDLCSSIKSLSPNIDALQLRLGGSEYPLSYLQHSQPVDELSSLACSFPQMTMINVNFPVTAEAIKHLSLLPKLTNVTIPNEATEMLKIITDAGLQGAFASLDSLDLSAASPALCIEFLKLVRPVHLRRLGVHLGRTYIPQAHDIRQMSIGLCDLCSHSQFEAFQIQFSRHWDGEPLTHNALEPLFAFTNLDFIRFYNNLFDLDNAALKRLAIAWPKLSTLCLYTRPTGTERSKICLEGLAELVARCPGLCMLTIELHISASSLQSWKETRGHLSNDTLWFLDLGRSTFCCDADELGRSLHTLFPNVTQFYAAGDEPGYSWDNVARHLGFPHAR